MNYIQLIFYPHVLAMKQDLVWGLLSVCLFVCLNRFDQMEAEVAKLMPAVNESGFNANQRTKLVSYIDDHLITLNTQLDTATFDRVLQLIHQRILSTFHTSITGDIEVISKRISKSSNTW